MNFVSFVLTLGEWETALLLGSVAVFAISSIAVLIARWMTPIPSLRDSLLASALFACLLAPAIGAAVTISKRPIISLTRTANAARPVVEEAKVKLPESSPSKSRSESNMTNHHPHPSPTEDAEADQTDAEFIPAVVSSSKMGTLAIRHKPRTAGIFRMLTWGWLVGTCLLAGSATTSLIRARRIRVRAQRLSAFPITALAEAASNTVGLPKPPVILVSNEIPSPVVVGYFSPTVILPPSVCESASDADLRNILIHECAHVLRRDALTVVAQAVARCVFWPIIPIHWLNRELGRSREEVCDNFVLAHTDAVTYGELLYRLAERTIMAPPLAGAMGILNWKGELETRIAGILDSKASRATRTSSFVKLVMAFSFVLLGIALCGTRYVTAQSPLTKTGDGKSAEGSSIDASIRQRPTTDSIGDPLPTGARLRMGTSRFHPPAHVCDLALSPDEETIVAIGDVLTVWNAKTGKKLWQAKGDEFGFDYRGPSYGTRAIAYSKSSATFCTPGGRDRFAIWDAKTGERTTVTIAAPVKARKGFFVGSLVGEDSIRSIDVTPDGTLFVVGSGCGLAVCDRSGSVKFAIPNVHNQSFKIDNTDRLGMLYGYYSMGRFSPDGKLLAVAASDRPNEIRLHDTDTGKELRAIKLTSKLVRLAFSPDASQIVATERDNAVRLYEVKTGRNIWSTVIELKNPRENYTSAVEFASDAKSIAVAATDYQIRLLDPSTGVEAGQLQGHYWYPWALAFSADSGTLFSSGWDVLIRRWDVAARKQLDPPGGVRSTGIVAASPDGRTLAFEDDSRTVRVISSDDGTERRKLSVDNAQFAQLLFSPDGRYLAAGGMTKDDVVVVIWDVDSGEEVRHWNWPKGRSPSSTVQSFGFSADGRRLAAAVFPQSSVYVWDVVEGNQLAQLNHRDAFGLAFSPDGTTLGTVGWDSTLRLWETENWKQVSEHTSPERKPRDKNDHIIDRRMVSVSYSPEGGLIAISHLDGMVRVLQADDLSLRSEFKVEWSISQGNISFSPNGLWLATGARGGEVELWDPENGQKAWVAGKHQSDATIVQFGRDNQTLVSGGEDRLAYLWDLHPQENDPPQDAIENWKMLSGEESALAYRAMWRLIDGGDATVALLTDKLRSLRTIVDPNRNDASKSQEENQSQQRMKKRLAEKDSKVQTDVVLRRTICVLEQIRTPAALRLIEELAARREIEPISRTAAAALHRQQIGLAQ